MQLPQLLPIDFVAAEEIPRIDTHFCHGLTAQQSHLGLMNVFLAEGGGGNDDLAEIHASVAIRKRRSSIDHFLAAAHSIVAHQAPPR